MEWGGEGGARAYSLASSAAAGPGERTVRLGELTPAQRLAPAPLGQASWAPPALTLQGQVPSPRAAT